MLRIIGILLVGLWFAPAFAQSTYRPIEQRLTAEQMTATGLDALSPAQLALLNRLLADEQAAVVSKVRVEAAASPNRPARQPVESTIRGTFRGWSPGTVLTLENGQQWKVVEGDLTVRASVAPRVTVRPGVLSGWYLQVEGQTPTARVSPVGSGR